MRIVSFIVFGGLVAAPGVAAAQTARAPVEKAESKDPNRMVCRVDRSTGSRLHRTKRCHTAAEWAAMQALDRREVEKIQANRGTSSQ